MKKIIIALIVTTFWIGCSNSKFSNPNNVVMNFHLLKKTIKFDEEYNFLSIESKFFTSQKLFEDIYSNREELLKSNYEILMDNVLQINTDPIVDKLRLYEIKYTMVDKNSRDTIDTTFFYNTVINENNKWKIVWTVSFYRGAVYIEEKGKFREAIKAYQEILQIDPFHNMAYRGISRCQYNLGLYELALENIKRAYVLAPNKDVTIVKSYIERLENLIKTAPNKN